MKEQKKMIDKRMQDFSKGKAKKVCIFGAGQRGIDLYEFLRNRLIKVDFFADNDHCKEGYFFFNMDCVHTNNLLESKEDILFIISIKKYEPIMNALKEKGFKYFTTKETIEKVFADISPVKAFIDLKHQDNIDYTDENIQNLIQIFNFSIYDICRHYEAIIEKLMFERECERSKLDDKHIGN